MRPRPVEILPTQADGLVAALRNGLVAPLNGSSVLAALEASDGPGLPGARRL